MNRALVLFTPKLPDRSQKWWMQFTTLIGPGAFAQAAADRGLAFEPLEDFTDPGSIEEATAFLHELATVELPDGRRVSEAVANEGYELWWLSYDELFYRQCVPYTQYRRLLDRLRTFGHVTLHVPPATALFRSFLEAHGISYAIEEGPRSVPALGVWIQALITLLSWPILMIKRPWLLVYTGDLFDPPRDHSFRMRFIYDELRAKKIPFAEFIRSLEPGRVMLAHAMKRRRPVIYSYALKVLIAWLADSRVSTLQTPKKTGNAEYDFRLALALHYTRNERAHAWSIRAMRLLVRSIGIRAAIIPAASSRTFHEVLGCRTADVPTIGILHGAASKYYNVYDFLPEYRGKKRLALDIYGVWSKWWRDYYIANGKAYAPEQIVVSGPMRPMSVLPAVAPRRDGPIKVLFVPGELSVPQEVMRYIDALRKDPSISFYLTFRPYRDQFEDWLKKNDPRILEELGAANLIFRGRRIQEDIAECDVVVGSYSTAVLEALLQFKPLVFFNSSKWGDYFAMREYKSGKYFAEDPSELIARIKQGREASLDELKDLQERFFGDPAKNGSAWMVDQAEAVIRGESRSVS
ncbi:hypothetical protein HYV30_04295 [Candidatus Kaiserbacteria bacterium]|nr:hypothetical protein [Candidatus Kaiserbacteria bacterium]